MIKYQYAKDDNEKLIDIDSLNDENRNRSKFFCIGCGNELIARLGKIKVHHFAHKKVVTCSGETYLHLLGKQLFFENYTDCLNKQKPFAIEIYQKRNDKDIVVCSFSCMSEAPAKDLMNFFEKGYPYVLDADVTSGEQTDGTYKVFVEIERHKDVPTQVLEMLDGVGKLANIDKFKFRYYKSFKSQDAQMENISATVPLDKSALTLDKDGRCLLKQKNLRQIKSRLATEKEKIVNYEISKDSGHNYSEIFKTGVATYAQQNLKVKNCFICRYHAENNSWNYYEDTTGVPIFCKFLKIKCNSNQAVSCEYFKLEKNYVDDILTTIRQNEADFQEYYTEDVEQENDDNSLGE